MFLISWWETQVYAILSAIFLPKYIQSSAQSEIRKRLFYVYTITLYNHATQHTLVFCFITELADLIKNNK